MKDEYTMQELSPDELAGVSGGAYSPGTYRKEAIAFLKEHMDAKAFEMLENHGDALQHPYVAAKIYLNNTEWRQYVFIEQHGSLNGFYS